jgi:hypothetical protein
MLKIKDDTNLRELQKFGYKYTGNYNRGDRWEKDIDIIVDGKNLGGILVQEWKEICFKFPYIKDIKYPDIEIYIQDLIQANLVEKVEGK